MTNTWIYSFTLISFIFLGILNSFETRSLKTFYRPTRTIKLSQFEEAKTKANKIDLPYLKLWESILTGRARPLSQTIKDQYKSLGLNHIFTPSGFHLSSVLLPFMKLLKHARYQFSLLFVIGAFLFWLPGVMALKRMVLIKSHQKVLGLKLGFVLALIIDIFFGTFQGYATSFTYSLLFLGIIYSGKRGLSLILWFFIGQVILSFFQGREISPLILFFNPILSLGFALIMPVLFLLSIPLWNWQMKLGLFLLKLIQKGVILFSDLILKLPLIEVNIFTLVLGVLLMRKRRRLFLIGLISMSNGLNLDHQRHPGLPSNEFIPQGEILKTKYGSKDIKIVYEDGSCRLRLVKGYMWKSCSPKRRSKRKNKI